MPALVMASQSPPSNKLERRKSIEDYQRQIINRIKDHFQRSRDEWQRKFHPQNKKLHRSRSGSEPVETSCCQESQNTELVKSGCEQCRNSPCRTPSVRILSSNIISNQHDQDSVQVTVDISEFLPDGEVTFRTEKNGLIVCAQFPHKSGAMEKVKVIPVTGLVETERIKVIPQSHGTMVLELKVTKH